MVTPFSRFRRWGGFSIITSLPPRGKGKPEKSGFFSQIPPFFHRKAGVFPGFPKRNPPVPGKFFRFFEIWGLTPGGKAGIMYSVTGGIAQLVRAPASHVGGHRFESCCPHQAAPGRTSRPRRSFFFYPKRLALVAGLRVSRMRNATTRARPAPRRGVPRRPPFFKGRRFPSGKAGAGGSRGQQPDGAKTGKRVFPDPFLPQTKEFCFFRHTVL